MNTFLSSVAVLLSTLALVCSGYTAYQVFTLQQTLNSTGNISNIPAIPTTSSIPEPPAPPSPLATPIATTSTFPSGKFIQAAFGNKAKVELLSAKRIKDPGTGNRDVVNVQMRVRRIAADGVGGADIISVTNTTARNPDTSETYKAVGLERSTGSVSLPQLRANSSADAYVWLRVPESVNNLDIFVPDTAAFKNVPVAN